MYHPPTSVTFHAGEHQLAFSTLAIQLDHQRGFRAVRCRTGSAASTSSAYRGRRRYDATRADAPHESISHQPALPRAGGRAGGLLLSRSARSDAWSTRAAKLPQSAERRGNSAEQPAAAQSAATSAAHAGTEPTGSGAGPAASAGLPYHRDDARGPDDLRRHW